MSFTDHFIFLGDGGEIARQGTLDSLSADGGDVLQRFASQPPAMTSRPGPEIPEDALHELEMLEDPEPRAGRHAGDMRIYAYYAKIAGWWTIAVYLLACVVFVFGVTFPCKHSGVPQ